MGKDNKGNINDKNELEMVLINRKMAHYIAHAESRLQITLIPRGLCTCYQDRGHHRLGFIPDAPVKVHTVLY